MAKVFLSYAREDTGRVRPLAQALEAAGHDVWWDQHITGGDQFANVIEQALNGAEVVVVVWTDSSCRSPWVRDEAAHGRDRDRLIPICLDGCQPPLGFRQFQAIDLRGWNGRSNSRMLEPLKLAIAAKADAEQRPAEPRHRDRDWFRRPRWVAAAAALLLIAAAALLFPRLGAFASSDSLVPKVALGEFAVTSPDLPRSISRTMHDEIMAAFGAENAVAVTAAAPGGGRKSVPFILDGSIRRDADALRLTVNLKDARSGTVLWSRAFDRAVEDMLATRQVAVAASQVVRCALWGAASYPRRMPEEALTLYLQFCNEQWGGSPDEQRMLDAARRLTIALPDFSFGWSALALAAVPIGQGKGPEADSVRAEALEAARKASALDELNPEGYMAEAGLLPLQRFVEREALLKKAISVRPTECGCERTAYGDFLASVGRMEEAVEQYRRAQAMMPLAPSVAVRLAQALYLSGRPDDAGATVEQMLQLWPDSINLKLLKVKSAFWTGRYDEALVILKAPGLHLTNSQIEAYAAAFEALRADDSAARAAAADRLSAIAADSRRNDRMAVAALAALGDQDAATEAALRLIQSRGHIVADVLFDPNLTAAGTSPRYAALIGRLGLAGYWRSTRHLPDLCSQSSKPGFCTVA